MLYVHHGEITPTDRLPATVSRAAVRPNSLRATQERLIARNITRHVVLAAHNILGSRGVLACFSILGPESDRHFQELADAVHTLGADHATAVWLGGLAYDSGDVQLRDISEERKTALARTRELVPETGRFLGPHWADASDVQLDVELNVPTATLTVWEHPVDLNLEQPIRKPSPKGGPFAG